MKPGVGIVILTALLTGCGSLKLREVNSQEVKTVRRVAIASFSFSQPPATSIAFNASSGRVEGDNTADLITQPSDEVREAYNDITQVLQTKFKWSVTPIAQLTAHPAYKKVYDGKMKGWQNKAMTGGKKLMIPEIMDSQSLRRMKPEEKDELMNALSVDAIMETDVTIFFHTKGIAVMGIADRYPQARISFWLYKKGVEKPIWFDGSLDGDPASESVGKTGFFDENKVTHLGRLSARNAFQKLEIKSE